MAEGRTKAPPGQRPSGAFCRPRTLAYTKRAAPEGAERALLDQYTTLTSCRQDPVYNFRDCETEPEPLRGRARSAQGGPREGREKRDPERGEAPSGLALPGAPSGGGRAGGGRGEGRLHAPCSAPGRAKRSPSSADGEAAPAGGTPAGGSKRPQAGARRNPTRGPQRGKKAANGRRGPRGERPGPKPRKRARSGPPWADALPSGRARDEARPTRSPARGGRREARGSPGQTAAASARGARRSPARSAHKWPSVGTGGKQGRPGPGERSEGENAGPGPRRGRGGRAPDGPRRGVGAPRQVPGRRCAKRPPTAASGPNTT